MLVKVMLSIMPINRRIMARLPVPKEQKEKSKLTKEEWREYTKTVWHVANTTHPEHPAVFPIEIPRRLIKLFSFHGETILDPFAGTGVTAQAAVSLGRSAICVEQNDKFVEIIHAECQPAAVEQDVPDALRVVHGDSRNLSFLDEGSVDLIVTSPPYWDKANYGDGDNNLGNIAGYRQFLEHIRPVFEECFRVLQPGRKLCVVTANVNQYTDHGLLTFPLAADFAVLLRDVGYVMVGEVIWSKDGTGGKWGSWGSQRPIFGSYPYPPNFLFKTVHEHILIFSKPPKTKVRNARAVPYDQLMAEPEAG
jgi:site-specific DNA-methyltransferase (adenine-specific)